MRIHLPANLSRRNNKCFSNCGSLALRILAAHSRIDTDPGRLGQPLPGGARLSDVKKTGGGVKWPILYSIVTRESSFNRKGRPHRRICFCPIFWCLLNTFVQITSRNSEKAHFLCHTFGCDIDHEKC